jgi:PhnB protein
MIFYKKCLGGELVLQTIGESPMADKMPAKMKQCILHSSLTNGALVVMATDCVPENGLIKGNAVSLCLNCSSEQEIKTCYKKLSEGGTVTAPLQSTFWGALFGGLTDKYGNHWLLNYQQEQ